MIKFNRFKPIIILLSLLSIGTGIITSQPYSPMGIVHDGAENNTETVSNNKSADNFKLCDTDEKQFQLSDYPGQIIILTFIQNMESKKVGKYWMDENRKWIEALINKYQNEFVICGIKEMTDIPRMIPKAFIRSTLRKESFRFLIDWEGDVFNKYPLEHAFTLLVIDADGQIYYELSDEFSESSFDELSNKIDTLINERLVK